MKNLKKVLVTALVSLFMVFSVASVASAAVTYTDGTYTSTYGSALTYKMTVTVSGGVITDAKIQVFYGETELTPEMGETNEQVKGLVDPAVKQAAELVETNDGSLVTSADDNFKALIADFESKAGKTEGAAAASDDSAAADTTSVPKTGVVGLGLVYGLGALATGAFALKRNEK